MLILLVGKFSFGQYPVSQSLGSDSTLVTSKGGLKGRIVVYSYADTTAANLERIRQYAGAMIFTTGANKLWYRNSAASAWVELGSSAGGVNIYNSDGTIDGPRNINGGGFDISWGNFGDWSSSVGAFTVSQGATSAFSMEGDTSFFSRRVSYATNLGSTFTRHTLVDKNYVDSLKNIIPTLQQVLTAGSTLTGDNTVSGGGFELAFSNNGSLLFNATAAVVGSSDFDMGAGTVSIEAKGVSPGLVSGLYLRTDSILIQPKTGTLNIDSLRTASDTTEYKPLVIGKYNRSVRELSYWPGGGGSPAGNNTNIQFKRNNAFTGSDSLNWTSTGLDWKGVLIQRNGAGTEQMRIFSDNQVNTFAGYGAGVNINFAGGGTDNTGFGHEALTSVSTGTLNTAVGKRALITVSTGQANTAVGAGALQKTTGSNNVGMGYHALLENTTGGNNIAIGSNALQNKTTGDENTVIGYQAASSGAGTFNSITAVGFQSLLQSTGDNNTAVGYQTLYSNTTGTGNVAIGHAAAKGHTGSNNVTIGYQVGINSSTRSNRLMIDNSNTDNPLIDGDFNADTLVVNGRLGVGASPSTRYWVGGSLEVNTTDVGNVGTGVDDLMTYSVPAGILSTNGDYLEFSFTFTFATNTNNKTVKVVYGATEIYTSTAQPQNDGTMEVKGKIIRTGATTQKVIVTAATDGTLFTDLANYTTSAETLSGAVTLKATGEATSSNDIINRILVVKYFPNN